MIEKQICYVHADDWGMIEIIPAENRDVVEKAMRASQTLGEQPGADASWNIPHTFAKYNLNISKRSIVLGELETLFEDLLIYTEELITGYSTDLETVENGFAFFDEDFGAFYGTHIRGTIAQLCFDNRACNCGKDFTEVIIAFSTFGKQHNLIVADWYMDVIVDFQEESAFNRYIEEE